MGESTHINESLSIGRYYKEVKKTKLISGDEQIQLAIRAKAGDKRAFDELVRVNLRFVISIAKDYQGSGISLEDLISEGNLGLIEAVNRFDETKGFKFISYAVWWIRQSIIKHIYDNGSNIRLPINRINSINKISKTKDKLSLLLGRDPSDGEILNFNSEITSHDLKSFNTEGNFEISVAKKVSEDGHTEISDILQGESNEEIEAGIHNQELRIKIEKVLSTLQKREVSILKLYFGLNGDSPKTLKEIGDEFGLTNERVRQIKEDALRQLRVIDKTLLLEEFL